MGQRRRWKRSARATRKGNPPSAGHRPLFKDFSDEYLASPIHGLQKESTRARERVILEY
jgi:hypothetical protein